MNLFLSIVIVLLLAALALLYVRTVTTMNRIDAMIESAIRNSFSEEAFSEQKLSKLESKMYRYLTKGETAQRQLTNEKDAIKRLVSDISHQTKTPIANIVLYSQLLSEKELPDPEARALVTQIEGQSEKLNFLIQSLIQTSRLEHGIIEVLPKEHSVKELLDALSEEFGSREACAALIFEPPPNQTAWFDWKWTLEALANIVDNAIKYTPQDGKIVVSAKDYEMFVRVDVADTGIGLSEEESAKIFTRFYRSPRVSEVKGVGIGLYLAREILQREGGYIAVASEVGKGSQFSVFLPKTAKLSKL